MSALREAARRAREALADMPAVGEISVRTHRQAVQVLGTLLDEVDRELDTKRASLASVEALAARLRERVEEARGLVSQERAEVASRLRGAAAEVSASTPGQVAVLLRNLADQVEAR